MLIDLLSSNVSFLQKVILFFTFSFAVIIALTMHEFAHAFMAHKLGDNTAKAHGRMTLNPLAHFDVIGLFCFLFLGFGWAKPVPINSFNFKHIKRDLFLVSISGIVTNFLLAFIFYPLFLLVLPYSYNTFFSIISSLFYYIFGVNLVLMSFNLLPIYPLDGFNAIASQLKYSNPFITFMMKYGSFILIGIILIFSYTNVFEYLVYYVGYPITKLWNLILLGF